MSLFAIGYFICTFTFNCKDRHWYLSSTCYLHGHVAGHSSIMQYVCTLASCHEFHILWCQLCHVTFCPKDLVTLGHKFCLSTIGSPNLLQLKLEEKLLSVTFLLMCKIHSDVHDFIY